jgi:transposase-like protein
MGRPKGGKNREWSKEEKLKVVNYYLNGHTQKEACIHFLINRYQLQQWLTRYNEQGIEGLQNKRKPGNPLAKYSRRKELTDIEKLEYELMLYKIEVERLKKGYTEEDVLLALEKLSEKNTK